MHTLVVLCEILDCTPNELIERVQTQQPTKRAAAGRAAGADIVPSAHGSAAPSNDEDDDAALGAPVRRLRP